MRTRTSSDKQGKQPDTVTIIISFHGQSCGVVDYYTHAQGIQEWLNQESLAHVSIPLLALTVLPAVLLIKAKITL